MVSLLSRSSTQISDALSIHMTLLVSFVYDHLFLDWECCWHYLDPHYVHARSHALRVFILLFVVLFVFVKNLMLSS